MIALRVTDRPQLLQELEELLIEKGVRLEGADICRLGPEQTFTSLSARDLLITSSLSLDAAKVLNALAAAEKPLVMVLGDRCTFSEGVEQALLGADIYLPSQSPEEIVRYVSVAGKPPHPEAAVESSQLESLLNVFSDDPPETSVEWSRLFAGICRVLSLDAVSFLAVGEREKLYLAAGERDSNLGEMEIFPVKLDESTSGKLVFARFDAIEPPLHSLRALCAVCARLLEQQVQRAGLLYQVLRAKREWVATVDAIGDPIVVLDRGGKVVRSNMAFAELVGRGIRDVVGLALATLTGTSADDPWWSVSASGSGDESSTLTFPICEERWFQVHRLHLSHEMEGSLVYLRDVTEERNLYSLLVQRERFAVLGEFADGIFHDLNNLATCLLPELSCARGVLPSVSLALEPLVEAAGEEELGSDVTTLREALDAAFAAGRRLNQVLNNLRQYRRLKQDSAADAGGEGTAPLELNSLLQALPVLFSARARRLGVTISLELGDLPYVDGNAGDLLRVFENLLKNALDALPSGGKISIVSSERAEKVVVEVRDTGVGIPAEILPRLFQRGFTTRRKSGGSGLGLYICKQLVEKHGGRVSVGSVEGVGSSFFVEVPVHQAFRDE